MPAAPSATRALRYGHRGEKTPTGATHAPKWPQQSGVRQPAIGVKPGRTAPSSQGATKAFPIAPQTMTSNDKIKIQEQIHQALEVKARHGYQCPAAVTRLYHSPRRYSIGFVFRQGVSVGDTWENSDGSRCEVVAIA